MNTTELTKLIAASGAVFVLLRVVFARPLIKRVINPHRLVWLLTGFGLLAGAITVLQRESPIKGAWAWLVPLKPLISDERTSLNVMFAAFGMSNGIIALILVGYAWLTLARDPGTFHHAKWAKVVRYYTRLRGGIDYSVLIQFNRTSGELPEVVAEGVRKGQVQQKMLELMPSANFAQQLQSWCQLGINMRHKIFPKLDEIMRDINHGNLRRALFDFEHGAVLVELIRIAEQGSTSSHDRYLVAFTLNQAEVNNHRFQEHFELMVKALRGIQSQHQRG
ncbi:MAG: hypothetical protein R3B84_07255 [Zavarzinella sp.]